MTSVVFVHGACHSAWCWNLVRQPLEDRGVTTYAVELPMTTLDVDAAVLSDLLKKLQGPVLVVAHSWGGSVATLGASSQPNVRHIIYLCALMLDVGVPAPAQPRQTAGHGATELVDEKFVAVPQRAKVAFYNDVDPALAELALSHLRPFSRSGFDRVPTDMPPAWLDIPTTYVVCTRDNAVHPDDQREMARRATGIVEWDTGHSPFLSRPQLVVDLVLERVGELSDASTANHDPDNR